MTKVHEDANVRTVVIRFPIFQYIHMSTAVNKSISRLALIFSIKLHCDSHSSTTNEDIQALLYVCSGPTDEL